MSQDRRHRTAGHVLASHSEDAAARQQRAPHDLVDDAVTRSVLLGERDGTCVVVHVGFALLHATDRTGEEDERVIEGRHDDAADMPDDDPVIARRVLGDDVALEGGEGVGD